MEYSNETRHYGRKMSIWSWIGVYIVAAAIIYGAAFLIYREAKDNGTDDNSTGTTQTEGLY